MKKLAVGIMSGTSLDGIDVAIAKIDNNFLETKLIPIAFETIDYSDDLLIKIKEAMNPNTSSVDKICSLNFELGYAYADAVKQVCKNNNIDLFDIDFVASHGQTVFHITQNTNKLIKSTLQLGEGSIISNLCKTTVVSNFRPADIVAGGQGAPLVPFADYVLFNSDIKSRMMLNIGGIANVTVLPKSAKIEEVFAFDTGPGNMMIDFAVNKLFNLKYDDNGEIAKTGVIINEMLNELIDNDYFTLLPPKSTGRELFGDEYTNNLISKYSNHMPEDIVCTLTHFTALTIKMAYENFVKETVLIDEVIVSGGGSYNSYLMGLLKEYISLADVIPLEDIGYNSSAKEALAFIILGNETLQFQFSNLKNATGAKNHVILGQVNYFID